MTEKALVERYAEELWNKKQVGIIREVMHPDVVIHSPFGDYFGHDSMETIVQVWLTAFPDMQYIPLGLTHEGDRVAAQWEAKATHRGDLQDVQASGHTVVYPGCTIYRIENGLIAEYWAYVDTQMVLDQLRGDG